MLAVTPKGPTTGLKAVKIPKGQHCAPWVTTTAIRLLRIEQWSSCARIRRIQDSFAYMAHIWGVADRTGEASVSRCRQKMRRRLTAFFRRLQV